MLSLIVLFGCHARKYIHNPYPTTSYHPKSHNRLQNRRNTFHRFCCIALGTNALIHSCIYLFELIYGDSKHHGWLAKWFSNKKKQFTCWSDIRSIELCYIFVYSFYSPNFYKNKWKINSHFKTCNFRLLQS